MANESTYSLLAKPDAQVLYDLAVASFKDSLTAPVHNVNAVFPADVDTIRVPVISGLTAQVMANELSTYSFSSANQYGEGGVDVAAVGIRSLEKASYFRDRFGGPINVNVEHEKAILELIEDQWTDLFTGLTYSGGNPAGLCTHSGVLAAEYTIKATTKGVRGALHAVLSPKQILELKQEIAGASVGFGLPAASNLLVDGTVKENKFVGSFGGINIFQGDLEASASVLYGCVFIPKMSFVTVIDPAMYPDGNRDSANSLIYNGLYTFANSALLKAGLAVSIVSAA